MYGRDGELAKLHRDRNNPDLPLITQRAAHKAYVKIASQLRDRPLMEMRLRLIKAASAGDEQEQRKITMQMRDYLGEDRETGLRDE